MWEGAPWGAAFGTHRQRFGVWGPMLVQEGAAGTLTVLGASGPGGCSGPAWGEMRQAGTRC